MQNIKKWLQLHHEMFRRLPWFKWVLLFIDLIFLGVGYVVSSNFGLVLGFLGILLNHLLSPKIAQRIFIKELNAEIRPSGSLDIKFIPKQDNDKQT